MRRIGTSLATLAFLVLFAGFGSADVAAAKRVALVIGNNAYSSLPVLQKAVNDAKAVASSLEGIGFKVFLGTDLTRRQMNRKLAAFTSSISPGDQAFLFFAGHGVAIGAENYLIPSDMPKPGTGEDDLVRDEGYAVSSLVARVQRRGAAATFFVLDACRDNPFAATGVRSIGGTRGLTRVAAPSGVFVLFSAGTGQMALDRLSDTDPNPNSVFTRKLIPLLQTPGLSHVILAKRVQQQVSNLAATVRHIQQPAYYDQIIGEIVLHKGGGEQTRPVPVPEPVERTKPVPTAKAKERENLLYLDTKYGRVVIKLRPDLAPKHVARVKKLVREGFYDGLKFHRVIKNFMAQTGDPKGDGTGGSRYPDLKAEFSKEPYKRGTVGAARARDPNSANSQFFITFKATPFLNGQYTVWGQVIHGMGHIDKIKKGSGPAGRAKNPDIIVKLQVAADAKDHSVMTSAR